MCAANGYAQGRYLTNYAHYDVSWFLDPRFLVGHVLFLVGMAINIYSYGVLRGLRKPGERGYKIPHGVYIHMIQLSFTLIYTILPLSLPPSPGGLFEYVSCANYLGEMVEWVGYAMACWSPVAGSFALWTTLFLGSRALQHHKSVQCVGVACIWHSSPVLPRMHTYIHAHRFYREKFEDYPQHRKAFIPFIL